ncbi:Clp protease N-terminal domain-containing protein [Longimicrobium sp.]|uniref:Clp protease N-terminal domain-containing protein n=1 Tax=Longimicrobium sp. TaxID=2029185 RepID=UPI002CD9A12E|nr:Clp protease N-terminal domain-containing protein [Longimicrobium sp.]HSU13313.1 Clp protease N-terminal domain-containing protein [Longimicrobium sp.]
MILDWLRIFRKWLRPAPARANGALDLHAFRRCTPTLARAREIAAGAGRGQVGDAEILLALLEHELIHATLVRTEVDPAAVRAAIGSGMRPGGHDVPLGDLPFGASAHAVLAQAAAEAGERGNDVINPLHLLAGLLRNPRSPACIALASCGCNLERLREFASGPERGPSTRL